MEQRVRQLVGHIIAGNSDGVPANALTNMATSAIMALVEKIRVPGELTLEEQCLIAAADNMAWHLNFMCAVAGVQDHVDAYNKAKAALLESKGVK